MRRTLFATLLVVVTTGLVAAQDKKDDKKATNLYPLTKGTKWEYELNAGGQKLEASQEVTDVGEAKKGERAVSTIASNIAGQKLTEEMSSDDKGVYRHAMNGEKLETPVQAIKYPAKAGTKWSEKIKIQGQTVDASFEQKDAEKVKVPAGEYTAFPVEMVIKAMGQTITATNWYADGVGIVKQEMNLGQISVVMELKKFTAGK